MIEFLIFLTSFLSQFSWTILQLIFVFLLIILIRKFKIDGYKVALFGFFLLFITMMLSIFTFDEAAGKVAEFMLIIFAVAFVQQFIHFLKHENK